MILAPVPLSSIDPLVRARAGGKGSDGYGLGVDLGTTFTAAAVARDGLPGLQTEVRLTRGEFEKMIRPAIDATIASLHRALHSARIDPRQLHTVLLVGGSSRIPVVAHLVSAELRRPTSVDTHPKHAIALGAAAVGAETAGAGAAATAAAAPVRLTPPPAGKAGPAETSASTPQRHHVRHPHDRAAHHRAAHHRAADGNMNSPLVAVSALVIERSENARRDRRARGDPGRGGGLPGLRDGDAPDGGVVPR